MTFVLTYVAKWKAQYIDLDIGSFSLMHYCKFLHTMQNVNMISAIPGEKLEHSFSSVMIRIYLHPLYIHKHVQGSQHIYQSAHFVPCVN